MQEYQTRHWKRLDFLSTRAKAYQDIRYMSWASRISRPIHDSPSPDISHPWQSTEDGKIRMKDILCNIVTFLLFFILASRATKLISGIATGDIIFAFPRIVQIIIHLVSYMLI
ncbi:hypothetical protein BO85DRAFT_306644 [Aspergillus piperis CBS 112811]|uniref:Uncharacterized protein n=1 Tax=Aspergillus piperis CBS 112811 TaxID=1448313 RepID=A0A8G1R1R6_9EURO|nr:hypothetical protein BO85DRAFT_306644 [Aspergillus piperis CBS 112811]RAH57587.1 hypothetical protein BO85DRAFT_306644 [Aspergillus piperis CBS 112811]